MNTTARSSFRHASSLAIALLASAFLVACQPTPPLAPTPPPGVTAASLTVTSKTFASKGAIPVDCSCDGSDRSPQVTWSAPPEGTKSFALVVEDPDAPAGVFTHWLVFDVAADASSLAEGVDTNALGVKVGLNDFKNVRYNGPCPPRRELHRYVFRVFALDKELGLSEGATKDALYAAMTGHVLGEGYVVGTFSR
jgi:Raf kinase inhibitor-like YbhB/YbcL family protein